MVGTDAVSGPMDPGLSDLPRLEKGSTGLSPVNAVQQRRVILTKFRRGTSDSLRHSPTSDHLPSPLMRLQIRFQGRVQGVGFRATALHCARGLHLSGFVRNELDGSVLLEAQGEAGAVELLVSRISEKMGHNISRVDRLDLAQIDSDTPFRITN